MNGYEYGFSLGTNAYAKATEQDKTILRFGMIPQHCLGAVGLDPMAIDADTSRGFASGMFTCAKADLNTPA